MGLAKGREKGGQVHHAKGLNGTHVQLTTQHPPEAGDSVATLVHCSEGRPCGRQEGPSGLRQGDAAIVPHEEGLLELSFESLDRGAETGLHDMDPGGGPGEVLFLGHSHEVAKLAKLHASILSMLNSQRIYWTNRQQEQRVGGTTGGVRSWSVMTPCSNCVERSVMSAVLTSERVINIHEMVVIHRAFRHESRLLGELIAATPGSDTKRAAVLARHLAWYQAGLTNHHHGEDELLWPLLYQHAGVDTAIVSRMERQHARVAETLAGAMAFLPAWQVSAGADRRDHLVKAISSHRRAHRAPGRRREPPASPRRSPSDRPGVGRTGRAFCDDHAESAAPHLSRSGVGGRNARRAVCVARRMPLVERLAWRSVGRRRYASYVRRVRGDAALEDRQQSNTTLTEV